MKNQIKNLINTNLQKSTLLLKLVHACYGRSFPKISCYTLIKIETGGTITSHPFHCTRNFETTQDSKENKLVTCFREHFKSHNLKPFIFKLKISNHLSSIFPKPFFHLHNRVIQLFISTFYLQTNTPSSSYSISICNLPSSNQHFIFKLLHFQTITFHLHDSRFMKHTTFGEELQRYKNILTK